jgi:hypothetical protein
MAQKVPCDSFGHFDIVNDVTTPETPAGFRVLSCLVQLYS